MIKRKAGQGGTTIEQYTLSCRGGASAFRTDANIDTTELGNETLYAGTEIYYDNDFVVFQQNGRPRPDQPTAAFLIGDAEGRDAPIYPDRYDNNNPGNAVGYMHPTEFRAVGMPFVSAEATMNVKCFRAQPRIDFRDGISVNQQAYI